jgi:hypothetical protein
LTHSPIAMVRTVRIDYRGSEYPGDDSMLLSNDEEVTDALPIIGGWNIAGDDGWEIVSTVPKSRFKSENVSSNGRTNYKRDRLRIVMTTSGF